MERKTGELLGVEAERRGVALRCVGEGRALPNTNRKGPGRRKPGGVGRQGHHMGRDLVAPASVWPSEGTGGAMGRACSSMRGGATGGGNAVGQEEDGMGWREDEGV